MTNPEKEKRHVSGIAGFEERKSLKKGEILHLRDDFRPFMKTRYWAFQDLFLGGGVFLYHQDEGFLEVKKEHIDWQENETSREVT
jgi:hypothetical protein